jgi:hypothetical protein
MLKFLKNLVGVGPGYRTPAQADPLLGPATGKARSADVRALMAVYADHGQDVSIRYAAVDACIANYFHGSEHAAAMYDAWVKNTPNDPFARLARAAFLLDQVPGYNPDDEDAQEKVAEGNRLRALAAEDHDVARRFAPDDPVVEAFIFRGHSPHEREEALYDSIIARAPTLMPAHREWFWKLTERWGGEAGATLDFARDLATHSRGTDLPLFVMMSHWERHWYLEGMCGDSEGAAALLLDGDVRAECDAAYAETLGGTGHRPNVDTWWFRQLASRWFYLVGKATGDPGDLGRARTELQRLGDIFIPEDSYFWWMTEGQYTDLRKEMGIQ